MTTSAQKRAQRKFRSEAEKVSDFGAFRPTFESVDEATLPDGIIGRISGEAAKLNLLNSNKRYYGLKQVQEAIEAANTDIERGRVLGELDHPEDRTASQLGEAAIKFTRLYIKDDASDPERPFLAYEGVILDNDRGHKLRTLLRAGIDVGMSTRGYAKLHKGTVKENGVPVEASIIDRFEFAGIDAVHNPSNAFGRISQHENEEDFDMPAELTLESLKESKPDLVKQIADAAKAEGVAEAKAASDAEKATLVEGHTAALAAKDAEKTTAVKEAVDAANAAAETAKAAAVTEAVNAAKAEAETVKAGAVKEAVEAAKAEAETAKATAVKEAVAAAETPLKEQIAALTAAKESAETKLAEIDKAGKAELRLSKIKEAVEKAEVAPFAVILRNLLESDATAEITDAYIAAKTKVAEGIWTATGKPKGAGKTAPSGANQTVAEEAEEKPEGAHQRLAGME